MIETPADTILGLAFFPNNQQLVSAGSDGLSRLWQLPVVEPKVVDAKGPVALFAVSADGSKVVTAGEKTARVWKTADGALIKEHAIGEPITAVAFKGDGSQIAVGLGNKSIRVLNADNGNEDKKIENLASPPTALAFLRPDGAQSPRRTKITRSAFTLLATPRRSRFWKATRAASTLSCSLPTTATCCFRARRTSWRSSGTSTAASPSATLAATASPFWP